MKSFIGQQYEFQSKLLKLSPNSREVSNFGCPGGRIEG